MIDCMSAQMEIKLKMNIHLAQSTLTMIRTLHLAVQGRMRINLYQSASKCYQLTSKSFIKRNLRRNFRFSAPLFFTPTFAFSRVSFQIFFHVHSFSFHVCLLGIFFTCKIKFSRALFDAILKFFTCTFFFSRVPYRDYFHGQKLIFTCTFGVIFRFFHGHFLFFKCKKPKISKIFTGVFFFFTPKKINTGRKRYRGFQFRGGFLPF